MLTNLRLQNFKSWKDTKDIRLASLTGLFGANSSGKTSLLQFLLMLKQTAESTDRSRVLHTGDDRAYVDLGTFYDLTYRHEESDTLLYALEWQLREPLNIKDPEQESARLFQINKLQFEATVRIDGRDYTTLTQHAIQSRIGVVLQTPHLFSGTIRDNIRYGRLEATDEEVEQAAKVAHAHDFIVDMGKGYDEDVGEGGNLLSVGQKQLVSIARAVLADPAILILDEATSSVDTLTEVSVQRGMEALMAGRTSFVIAHRLSTIKRADRILVLKAGRIVEVGAHTELIHARGHYYDLYTRQFRREREQVYGVGQFAAAVA